MYPKPGPQPTDYSRRFQVPDKWPQETLASVGCKTEIWQDFAIVKTGEIRPETSRGQWPSCLGLERLHPVEQSGSHWKPSVTSAQAYQFFLLNSMQNQWQNTGHEKFCDLLRQPCDSFCMAVIGQSLCVNNSCFSWATSFFNMDTSFWKETLKPH